MLLEKPHKHLSGFAGQNTADIAAAVLQMVEDMRDLRLQIALSGRKIMRAFFAQLLRKHMLEDIGAQLL